MRYDLLTRNPLLAVQIPRSKVVNKKKQKPHITPEEFDRLVANWGGKGAKKRIKLVRSDAPHDLVFPSLRTGAPMRDGNILRRHLRPAALKLGMDPKKATSRSLRTSCATWMVEAGANPKDVQGDAALPHLDDDGRLRATRTREPGARCGEDDGHGDGETGGPTGAVEEQGHQLICGT